MHYTLLSLLLIFLDREIIPFYSCLSDGYTQQKDKNCKWPSGKSGQQFHSLEETKTSCTIQPECTMFYEHQSIFWTCPVGSAVFSFDGATLYTAILGTLS